MALSEKPKTVPVRLPKDMAESVKRVAAMKDQTPAEAIAEAWAWYWNRNGERAVNDMHATIEALRP